MQIMFGLSLDARQDPSPRSYFNAPVVGRLGFLSLLETYLGLRAPEATDARRVAVYMGHLQEFDDGSRFYSQSTKADSIGTAAHLLSWRDEWRLGGWQGMAGPGHPARLRELAAVEAQAIQTMPPGEAERLVLVIQALEATGSDPIAGVTVVDPIDDFPLLWRQVLARLPSVNVIQPEPQGAGALRDVQVRALRAMSGKAMTGERAPIHDGCIQVVRALSATTLEHWLSGHHAASPGDRLVMAEDLGESVDTTLMATGGVNCGFGTPSQLRPALQAIGLALNLCWTPLDVSRLVEFLTHPVGPFSRRARFLLARAMAEQPGIGGRKWAEVKAKIAAEENGKEIAAEVEFWLEGDRWPRSEGAPLSVLLARVERLREALRRRLSGESATVATFAPAYRQCTATHDALSELARQGVAKVLPRQIEQLLAHATPSGAANPWAQPHVGCMRSASSPGACIEPADEVIWWMPSTPVLAQPLPWSPAEVQALNDMGVELRDPAKQLASLAKQWLRPLLAARKRFVVVLPPPGAEVHPVRQLLEQLVPDFEAGALDLDSAMEDQRLGALAEPVRPQRLPEIRRYIELPAPLTMPEKPQSYSSLNELFNAPALYALKRIARLNSTSLVAAEEDNRLLGILAHRIFEKLFAHPDALAWSNQRATDWFKAQADELLRTEGAVLLMQGAGVSLRRFLMTCEGAICNLLDHLREAGAVCVQAEKSFNGALGGVPLKGTIDLLVELSDESIVALDMKWRGDTYYAGMLKAGRHLQLAMYSTLVEQQTGTAPVALGYFILESGALFLSHPDIFPNAQVRRPPERMTVTTLLHQARASWAWRTGQFRAGQVEVVPEAPSDEYQGPPGALPVNGPTQWDREHLVLLGGWE